MFGIDKLVKRMQARITGGIQEELNQYVKELMNQVMKDAFDPAKLMDMLKSMGVDPSKLAGMVGMVGQQPGFDPYQVLGLDKSASDEEVKKRYREMMAKVHPDKVGQEMSFLAAIVNAAYDMIKMQRKWT